MTIFLTTQYLEEADELADRVGIINDGRLVAEGTPDELKRSVGNDVIVARVDGNAAAAAAAVEALAGVRSVEARGDEMIVTATDGAATIGAVAVALNTVAPVRHLTLRTPTLDDVFLELTGNHIQSDEADDAVATRRPAARARGGRSMTRLDIARRPTRRRERSSAPGRRPPCATSSPSPAGPCGRPPRAGDGDPADLHRPVLLRRQHRDAAASHREPHQGLRHQGVHDADRHPHRRHRRVAGGLARARHPGRLLRSAAAHAGAAAGDPPRAHGRRRRRRLRC